ncbi:hypothetical protein CRM22_007459 [Opisthorchis felineus]|uniref:Uncharacterized protein n=1 Tax=Opisthorchis felineus TaxID=147828 RepID=A0A4S2LFR4_OPIFE|nr:hypothetical protein CRM22_007459 [Opisthorchis felineus]
MFSLHFVIYRRTGPVLSPTLSLGRVNVQRARVCVYSIGVYFSQVYSFSLNDCLTNEVSALIVHHLRSRNCALLSLGITQCGGETLPPLVGTGDVLKPLSTGVSEAYLESAGKLQQADQEELNIWFGSAQEISNS